MDDIKNKVLENLKEEWDFMSDGDKKYLLGLVEGIKAARTARSESEERAETEEKTGDK